MNEDKLAYPSKHAMDMLCAPIYCDMASAAYGLYENKDTYLPYALFVVSCDEDKTLIMSSHKWIAQKAKPFAEWQTEILKKNGIDYVSELSLRIMQYEPWVATMNTSSEGNLVYMLESYLPTVDGSDRFKYAKTWKIPCSKPGSKIPLQVVLFRDSSLSKLPDQIENACDRIIEGWKEYIDNWPNEIRPPRHDANVIFEEIICGTMDRKMISRTQIATKISSLYYESGRSKGTVIFAKAESREPFIKLSQTDQTLKFSVDSAKQLRKLLEMTKDGLSLLVHDDDDVVYGIGKSSAPLYSFHITGHMEWNLSEFTPIAGKGNKFVEKQVLRYKHGDYYFPLADEMMNWYINSRIHKDSQESPIGNVIRELLKEENVRKFSCGALLIFADKAQAEVERLSKRKRGIATGKINLLRNLDKASALCAIDGALIIDFNGYCHGIGMILDGEANIDGTPARGARYNCAKTYLSRCCEKKINAFGVIISQDGYIDILSTYDKECRPYE